MYRYREIRQLHLEITTACNASCPLCLRNVLGGLNNPYLPITELRLDDITAILPADFVQQLQLIYLCGNYGDPMAARDTLDVLEYFRGVNPRIRLGIHTNGSARTPEWWARLAPVVDYCRFGIDGLEDTNHLYRRGTQWKKVMESVAAFIGAGGRAEWDFIVFRHNEHQVEEARELSRKLGFARFFTKNTYRFFNPIAGRRLPRIPVLSSDGNLEHVIEEPVRPEFQNQSLIRLDDAAADTPSYAHYLDQTDIHCKVSKDRSLYISAEGLAFPCCWTGNLYAWYQSPPEQGVGRILEEMPDGKRALDARLRPLQEIVEGPFFQQLIPGSWSRPSISDGKLEVCARTCGKFDLVAAQYANGGTRDRASN